MKRFLVEWHEASGIPDVMPQITPRAERVAVVGAGPAGLAVARELATKGYQVTVFDSLPYAGGTMLIGVPAFRLPREAIEMDVRLVERLGRDVPLRHDDRHGHHLRAAPAPTSTRSPSRPGRWTRSRSTSRAPTSRASTTASTS